MAKMLYEFGRSSILHAVYATCFSLLGRWLSSWIYQPNVPKYVFCIFLWCLLSNLKHWRTCGNSQLRRGIQQPEWVDCQCQLLPTRFAHTSTIWYVDIYNYICTQLYIYIFRICRETISLAVCVACCCYCSCRQILVQVFVVGLLTAKSSDLWIYPLKKFASHGMHCMKLFQS